MTPFDPASWHPPDDMTTAGGLVVRPWNPGDGAALVDAVTASIDHLSPWMPWAEAGEAVATVEARVRRFHGLWHAREDFLLSVWDGATLVGGSGFHLRWGGLATGVAEIGMWIAADRAHRGVGTSVLQELTRWGLSDRWPFRRLMWLCHADNAASAAVARKAGYTLEGHLRGPSPSGDGAGDPDRTTLVFGFNDGDDTPWTAP